MRSAKKRKRQCRCGNDAMERTKVCFDCAVKENPEVVFWLHAAVSAPVDGVPQEEADRRYREAFRRARLTLYKKVYEK